MAIFNANVATELSTLNFREFVNYVDYTFMAMTAKLQPKARQIYHVMNIGNNSGTERLFAEYDGETFAKYKPEGADVRKARVATGYSKLAKLKRFGLEVDITEEMQKFNKEPEIIAQLTRLSGFGTNRQELDLTHRFTFAGATTYVDQDGQTRDVSTADGLSLVNATHTLANSSLTYSNRISGDPVFSATSLESAQIIGSNSIYSNLGEKRVFTWDYLVVSDHPTVLNEARRQMQSTASVTGPNNAVVNVFESLFTVVSLPWLATTATGAADTAKKNYWFLVSKNWSGYLAEWEPEHLISPNDGNNNLVDWHADVYSWGVRIGYDIVIVSGRGVIGSLNAT